MFVKFQLRSRIEKCEDEERDEFVKVIHSDQRKRACESASAMPVSIDEKLTQDSGCRMDVQRRS